jgi:AraC-like DNA-binding protein
VFSETGAATFFRYSMHELFCRCYSLDDLTSGWRKDNIAVRLREAKTDTDRIRVIEEALMSRLNRKVNDELIASAVELIKQYAGNIKITVLTEKLNISLSQLEKRFRRIVGASPKKFASIVRLRNVIYIASNETSMTRLGLEAGYFDQAHFIKDFKSFTGVTPERYFKRK